ncbi:MAG: glycosyltransferase family 2 protein [Odoribacter sp.]
MMVFLYILDILLFIIFALNILYLTFFSIASLFRFETKTQKSKADKKIAILIPAYKEDGVIMECVCSCIAQNYPPEKFDVVVISDRMSGRTNQELQRMSLILVEVFFENSTKAKALNYAMEQIGSQYDIALILDADNIVSPNFLQQINDRFHSENVHIVQAHRCAKNINTPLALLDAISEEINNSIFRKGHAVLGLSAALIGSGMCFDYQLFKDAMLQIDAVGGFDRALEINLLRGGYHVYYMPNSHVLDEKVQHKDDFSRQRKRWLSAQIHYLCRSVKYVPAAIKNCQVDFLDKMFQQISIPRVMLLGFSVIIASIVSIFSNAASIKWWLIVILLYLALSLAIPRKMYRRNLFTAIIRLPYFFFLVVFNLFKLKGANKKFIHTSHGIKE